MRVTDKGQVTIPKELRDELGITPGCEVRVERAADGVIVRRVGEPTSRGERIVDRLRGRGNVAMTTDEIMALTRDA